VLTPKLVLFLSVGEVHFHQDRTDGECIVLMRAAQIQQTDRCAILLEGDYREPRSPGSTGISTQHQPKEENEMADAKKNKGLSTVILSKKVARHVEKLKEYSELSGIPLHDLLDEALSEYIARPVETGKS
jgi:hypothetical protein